MSTHQTLALMRTSHLGLLEGGNCRAVIGFHTFWPRAQAPTSAAPPRDAKSELRPESPHGKDGTGLETKLLQIIIIIIIIIIVIIIIIIVIITSNSR